MCIKTKVVVFALTIKPGVEIMEVVRWGLCSVNCLLLFGKLAGIEHVLGKKL